MKVAIVGAGISGLTVAQLLKDHSEVSVFEQEPRAGGLLKCRIVGGSLFHTCGGHVFNTKSSAVEKWFWSKFDKSNEFVKTDRKSAICMGDGKFVEYPIENHVYMLDKNDQLSVVDDWLQLSKDNPQPRNFEEFLLGRFGRTLYDLYFRPYNSKIWKCNLSDIPLDWLDGKLPMPTIRQMIAANIDHTKEKEFVHSSFYYPRHIGSQFIIDRLSEGISIRCCESATAIDYNESGQITVNGEKFDEVFFCGNLKDLPKIAMPGLGIERFCKEINNLNSHGTTSVFCESDPIPYSWFYQPSTEHDSHRFICTGNFSSNNNAPGKMTCVVEFTGHKETEDIYKQLCKMPFHPKYLTHNYSPCTYPIQSASTRAFVATIKESLRLRHVRLVGRFAEWEYYNMDSAIQSAMNEVDNFICAQ